jgi:hypothetical protein
VREQHAHGAVDAARLDRLGGGEGFDVEVFGLVWDDGEEDAQAEFGADSEAVRELGGV